MDAPTTPVTPFDRIGGEAAVLQMVNRFYDLMESDPHYAALRAMHEEDLFPMRASLTGFLTAWMGGPRTWFEERQGACIMSIHKKLAIGPETAKQWVDAMGRAAKDTINDDAFVKAMVEAFAAMSAGMARNAEAA